jgi:hypothetical protein
LQKLAVALFGPQVAAIVSRHLGGAVTSMARPAQWIWNGEAAPT